MKLFLDVMLGTLATYLRMVGHDAAYALDRNVEEDDEILALARTEDRTLVTRDVDLAGRSGDAILLRDTGIEAQLRQLRDEGIELSLDRPERCSRCNATLARVSLDQETPPYAPSPADTAVWQCDDCGQFYWRGSHWDDVRDRLDTL